MITRTSALDTSFNSDGGFRQNVSINVLHSFGYRVPAEPKNRVVKGIFVHIGFFQPSGKRLCQCHGLIARNDLTGKTFFNNDTGGSDVR